MEEKKSVKFSLNALIPILALACAGVCLIFAFTVGVTFKGAQSAEYYIYHFFDGNYINSISQLEGAAQSASRAVMVFGMLISILGLVAVLAFSAVTCAFAIRKYVYKKEHSVEKFALFTYLSYIVFAALFYAVNCVSATGENAFRSTYNVATILGITLSSLIAAAYVGLKIYDKRNYFKKTENLLNLIFAAVRIVFVAVVMGLVTAPIISIKAVNAGTTVKGNFIQLLTFNLASADADKLSSLISASTIGFIAVAAFTVLSAVFIANNVSAMFSKKKADNVFYIIGFAVTVLILFLSTVAAGFFSDIVANIAALGASKNDGETVSYIRNFGGFSTDVAITIKNNAGEITDIISVIETVNISLGIPLAVVVLGLVTVILNSLYPVIMSAGRKIKKKVEVEESASDAFLEVKNLCKYFVVATDFFGRPTKSLKAVDNVSFRLEKGKTLGIVGESGCGKTTMGRTLLRLYDVTSGEVWFKGEKISALSNREFDKLRPNMQMIFQDPYASLSPRLTVGEIIGEAVKQHKLVSKEEYHDYVLSVMKMCGLQPHYFERYPHEFSGGQRQRICIARALALKPELVICDEPVSALDVSIQAQIINMLIELRKTLGLTYVFISHDLSVVKHISDEVGVMYLGSLVEYGSKHDIFENTFHPYTKALFSAVPVPDPHVKMNRIILKGDIPSPVNPPSGCKFHTRCESCMDICGRINPIYKEVEAGHFCACHLYNTEEETQMLESKYEEELREAEERAKEHSKKSFSEVVKGVFKKQKPEPVTENEAEDVPKE